MDNALKETLIGWAQEYNDPKYFQEDPIAFPTRFASMLAEGKAALADVEIAALLSAHLAWGRRAMIVRDCSRMFDEMGWRPYDYIMNGEYRDEDASLHRTIKWSEFAAICGRLQKLYSVKDSIEGMTDSGIRVMVFGQKEDAKAPNKKISMMRRWMVRDDGKVDLGLWKNSDKRELVIPLDVHVYDQATCLGLTARRQKDIITAREITDAFREIWPDDPCMGDFALFGYGVNSK
ncbi:MAG: TIGR02757 family protein [Bacteroidales bacterium]|nr:TIGR02757 family protein [Bacteroidales bacterium]